MHSDSSGLGFEVFGHACVCAPAREPVRAPRPYLQRRAEVVRAKLALERMPDTSTTFGLGSGFRIRIQDIWIMWMGTWENAG